MRRQSGLDRQLGLLLTAGTHDEYTDGQLLERFSTLPDERAEQAFEALVHRHGPMVLRVCRASLRDPHDADDVFQATFLVLAKQARSLWVRDSLGPWLHQVAMRTSACLRSAQARRRKHETRVALQVHSPDDSPRRDPDAEALEQIIHQELNKLPERFRVPVVLCDLEGQTHEQAARNLGLPVGTVKSRLSRARERLRTRLTHRGLSPSAVTALVAPRSLAGLAITDALARSTTLAAVRFLTTRTLLGGSAALLAKGVLSAMLVTRIRNAVAILFAATTISGAGLMGTLARTPDKEPPADLRTSTAPDFDELDLPIVKAGRGSFRSVSVAQGLLEDAVPSQIICEVKDGAKVLSLIRDGVMVKKGEILGTLDDSSLQEQLVLESFRAETARAEHASTRRATERAIGALEEYRNGVLSSELRSIERELQLASDVLKAAEDGHERAKKVRDRITSLLSHRGSNSQTASDLIIELDMENRVAATRLEVSRANASLEDWQSKLELVKSHTSLKKIKDLESEIEGLKTVERLKQTIADQQTAKVKDLERQIASCTLVAPHSGLFLIARNPEQPEGDPNLKAGDHVSAGRLLLRVINMENPIIARVLVGESSLDILERGQAANIQVLDYSKENGPGKIIEISREQVPESKHEGLTKLYPVRVQFDQAAVFLRPGMKATVEIPIVEENTSIYLPASAIVTLGGKDYVFIRTLRDGHVRREVAIGAVHSDMAEIKEGVKGNERVVTNPLPLLTDAEKQDNERNKPAHLKPRRGA